MPFNVKDWRDYPDRNTPITAASLEDMEHRLSDYVDTVGSLALSTYNAGQFNVPVAAYAAPTDAPDKVTFTLTSAKLVRVNYQANIWIPGSGNVDVQLRLDGATVKNNRGNPVEGHIGSGVKTGAGLSIDQLPNGLGFFGYGGGNTNQAPAADMGTPLALWLAAGAHTIEVVYQCTVTAGYISNRLLVVTG